MAKSMSPIMLRVEPRLREAIARQAEKDQRTVSGIIRKVLADYLDQEEGRRFRTDTRERARA